MCMLCVVHGGPRKYNLAATFEGKYQFAYRTAQAEAMGQTLVDFMRGKRRWGSLHGHCEMSMLDGGAKIEDIMIKAKAMGQDFVAITDHGNLFGAVRAHQAAKKHGIKHIVGCEFYLTPVGKSRFDKDIKKGERAYHHMVALAMNNTGYRNLCKLSAIGYRDGFYRQPRIDREALEAHSEGIIVTSACVGGAIPMNAYDGNFYQAETELEFMMRVFGDRFYIEIQDHGIEIEDVAFDYMRTVAQKYNIPTVVTSDAHYLNIEDYDAHDALLCIGTGQKVDQEKRTFQFDGQGYHYMSEEEIVQAFPHDMDAIYRAGEIADRCDDSVIEFGNVELPSFPVPADKGFGEWKRKGGSPIWQLT